MSRWRSRRAKGAVVAAGVDAAGGEASRVHQRAGINGRRRGRLRRREGRPRPNRPAVRFLVRVLVGAVVVAGAAVGVAALRLSGIAGDLRAARHHLDVAVTQLEDGQVGSARASLAAARELLVGANADLYGTPDLAVVAALPVAGPNLHAIRRSVSDVLGATGAAERVLRAAAPMAGVDGKLEVTLRSGAIPLEVVDAVQHELRALRASLPLGSPPESPLLLPQVRDLGRDVHETLAARRQQVDALDEGLTLLEEMCGGNGDRRYLVAVANSAEMRATGGMILSYGFLEGRAGDLELTGFGGIDELFLAVGLDELGDDAGGPAAGGGVDQEELARWDGLEPLRLWRNANLVPDPTVVAPRLEAMAEAVTGLPFDGVVHVDPHGLAAILDAVGPVDVDAVGHVDAANVVDLTLNRAYVDLPDRDRRQEVLGDVAEAAFRRLVGGDFPSLRPLGEALARAAAERHISLWSGRPAAAQPAAAFHADAALPAPDVVDHLLLTVQNFSKNKLDYYLDTRLDVTGARPGAEPGTLTATVMLTNTAPADGRVAYVFGPNAPGEVAGLYRGTVSLYLPRGTTLLGSEGGSLGRPGVVAEGGRTVVGFDVEIPAGETSVVTVHLATAPRPAGAYELTLVPVPRVRPTVVSVDVHADGARARRPARPLLVQEVVPAR